MLKPYEVLFHRNIYKNFYIFGVLLLASDVTIRDANFPSRLTIPIWSVRSQRGALWLLVAVMSNVKRKTNLIFWYSLFWHCNPTTGLRRRIESYKIFWLMSLTCHCKSRKLTYNCLILHVREEYVAPGSARKNIPPVDTNISLQISLILINEETWHFTNENHCFV